MLAVASCVDRGTRVIGKYFNCQVKLSVRLEYDRVGK